MIQESDFSQVDAVVHSINPQGFFAHAGPLKLFVSAHVRHLCSSWVISANQYYS